MLLNSNIKEISVIVLRVGRISSLSVSVTQMNEKRNREINETVNICLVVLSMQTYLLRCE